MSVPTVPPAIGGIPVRELVAAGLPRGDFAVPTAVTLGGPSMFRRMGSEWVVMARFEDAAVGAAAASAPAAERTPLTLDNGTVVETNLEVEAGSDGSLDHLKRTFEGAAGGAISGGSSSAGVPLKSEPLSAR